LKCPNDQKSVIIYKNYFDYILIRQGGGRIDKRVLVKMETSRNGPWILLWLQPPDLKCPNDQKSVIIYKNYLDSILISQGGGRIDKHVLVKMETSRNGP
jgi:signal recognition particle subunit SEC65